MIEIQFVIPEGSSKWVKVSDSPKQRREFEKQGRVSGSRAIRSRVGDNGRGGKRN
jgi:hypothetical protein